MTIRLKVIDGKRAIMVHVRIERQHQRRALLDDPHSRVTTSMYPPFVTFGTLEPTLHIQIICRPIGRLAAHKQPTLKTAHHCGKLLVNGIGARLPVVP